MDPGVAFGGECRHAVGKSRETRFSRLGAEPRPPKPKVRDWSSWVVTQLDQSRRCHLRRSPARSPARWAARRGTGARSGCRGRRRPAAEPLFAVDVATRRSLRGATQGPGDDRPRGRSRGRGPFPHSPRARGASLSAALRADLGCAADPGPPRPADRRAELHARAGFARQVATSPPALAAGRRAW